MFSNFDHLGVAVRKIDDAILFYTEIMGGKVMDRYTSDAPGVEVHVAVIEVGGMTVELLEPTNNNSPIARFMKIKGPGVHHVAYRVENLDETIREAKKRGARFMEETLRINKRGRRLIYMHLASRSSALIELCDYPS